MRRCTITLSAMLVIGACADPVSPRRDERPILVGSAVVAVPTSEPALGGGDRVLFDTRTALQTATTLQQAWAAFPGNDHTAAYAATTGTGWSFATNFDGAGTHALRMHWKGTTGCIEEPGRIISYLPQPYPHTLVVTWKQRLGRDDQDPAGTGAANSFMLNNAACPGAGRHVMTVARDNLGNAGSFYLWWLGQPATPLLENSAWNGRVGGNQAWNFVPGQNVGRTITQTLYLRAESATGASDGGIALWIDGRLYYSRSGLALGPRAMGMISFPDAFGAPAVDQTEYFWDMVAWEPTGAQPAPVARVAISPSSVTVAPGNSATLAATTFAADSTTLTGRTVAWSSADTSIATVSVGGVVVGRREGATFVRARSEGVSDSARVTVHALVATVGVVLNSAALTIGQTTQATATAKDSSGATIGGRSVQWVSSAPSVATVDASGMVSAIQAGSATITAAVDGVSGSAAVTVTSVTPPPADAGCPQGTSGLIWCDDFEQNRLSSYFEYDSANGSFTRVAGVGVNGGYAMRAHFAQGQASAGSLKLAFGRTPSTYFRPVDAGTANYREIYWRFYVRNAPNWIGGGGDKLTRATVFARSDWSQAMIAHLWGAAAPNSDHLVLDPASGTDPAGNVVTSGYNDFAHLTWLGQGLGRTPVFDPAHVGQWHCVEAHVRLNDAGQSNGVFEFWLDSALDAQRTGLNWLGSYNAYGMNAIFLENYWNTGSPQAQDRYIDGFVVGTQRIGCGVPSSAPAPTTASVSVVVNSSSLQVGQATQAVATARDGSGNVLSGKTAQWSSTNNSVATVDANGRVTAVGAGSASVSATIDGVSGSAGVSVAAATPVPVASVQVSPANASVAVGGQVAFTAVARDASGNQITGRSTSWASSMPGVATIDASGLASGVAAGSTTITASVDGVTNSTPLTVVAPAPPTAGIPQPGANDVIVMDLRQAIQQATTASQALAFFPGNDHTALRGAQNTRGWSFSTNFDGKGTHALRVDWAQQAGDQEVRLISYLPLPKPREMYIQYKARLGKHPADPDGNGADNTFPLFPASTGPKRFLIGRTDVGGSANGRLDYVWTRSNPSAVRAQIDWFNWGINGNAADWSPQNNIGKEYTTTIYVKVSSNNGTTNGAADGIYRVWIDGKLVLNGTNLTIGSWALDLLNFPTINGEVPAPCSEYYWDFLIWKPGA